MANLDLNRKEIVDGGGTGPAFLPFKEELHAVVEVLAIKEMSNRSMGKHIQTFVKCVSCSNSVLEPGVEYSIPSQVYSNKADQADASTKDLRGQLAAMRGVDVGDKSFDANAALGECLAYRDELGVRIQIHQTVQNTGKTRRYYAPV